VALPWELDAPVESAPVAQTPPATPWQNDAPVQGAAPALPEEPPNPSIMRQVGLTGRAIAGGAGQVLDMVNNAGAAAVNIPAMIGHRLFVGNDPSYQGPLPLGAYERATTGAADAAGLPQPANQTERDVQTIGSNIAAAAIPGGGVRVAAGRMLSKAPEAIKSIGAMLAEGLTASPAADVAVGAGAGAGQVAGEHQIGGEYGGAIGQVGGMVLTALAHGAGSATLAALRPPPAANRAASGIKADAPITPEEAAGAFTSEDIQAVAHANGITDPADPRMGQLQDVLTKRRAAEADPLVAAQQRADVAPPPTPNSQAGNWTPAQGVQQLEPAITAQVDAEIAGGLSPSRPGMSADQFRQEEIARRVRGALGLEPAETPATIQVGPSGMATPLDAEGRMTPEARGTTQGILAAGDTRAAIDANATEAFRLAELQRQHGQIGNPETSRPADYRSLSTRQSEVQAPRTEAEPNFGHTSGTNDMPPVVPAEIAPTATPGIRPAADGEAPKWIKPDETPKPTEPTPEPPKPVDGGGGGVAATAPADAPLASAEPNPHADIWRQELAGAQADVARHEADMDTMAQRSANAQRAVSQLEGQNAHLGKAAQRNLGPIVAARAELANSRRALSAKAQLAEAARGRAGLAQRMIDEASQGQIPTARTTYADPSANRGVALPKAPRKPESLFDAIRFLGGIKDTGGELRAMDLNKGNPGIINNPSGMSLDKMSIALHERGFLQDGPDLTGANGGERGDLEGRLLDQIHQHSTQGPVYPVDRSAGYHADLEAHDAHVARMNEVATDLGISLEGLRGLSVGQLHDLMAERMSLADAGRLSDESAAGIHGDIELLSEQHVDDLKALHDALASDPNYDNPVTLEDINREWDEWSRSLASGYGGEDGATGTAGSGRRDGQPEGQGNRPEDRGQLQADPGGGQDGGRQGSGAGADAASGQPGQSGLWADNRDAPAGQRPAGQDGRRGRVDSSQGEIPGTEGSTRQAVQARDAAPNRGNGPQSDMSAFDMFDPHARDQASLPGVAETHVTEAGTGAEHIAGLAEAAAKAADDSPRGLPLYSNPIFDPAAWKFLFGPVDRAVIRPFVEEWIRTGKAWRDDAVAAKERDARLPRNTTGLTPAAIEGRMPAATRGLGSFLRAALYSDNSAMRAMSDRLPQGPASDAAHKFLDLFHARAGVAGDVGKTFHEGVSARTNQQLNKLGDILGKFADAPAAMKQIVRMVQNPRTIRAGTPMGDAAKGITGWLGEHLDYLQKNGVEVNAIRGGYFPRRLDIPAVWRNPQGFTDAAERAYRAAGSQDAKGEARAWLDAIKSGTLDTEGPLNGRVLSKIADQHLADFMVTDPRKVLVGYASGAAHRGELSRIMGPNARALADLKAGLQKGGADAALPRFVDYMNTQTGQATNKVNPQIQKGLGWMRLMGTMGLMDKATLTSLTEVFAAPARSGRLVDLYHQSANMVRYWRGAESSARLSALAEDLGTMTSHLGGSFAASRWVGEAGSELQASLSQKYFRMIGLEQWSHGMNVGATGVADTFLSRMAKDLGAAGRPGREANFSLSELGVAAKDAPAFSAWLKGLPPGGMTTDALKAAPPRMGDLYRTAVFRFTRQVHMQPTAATKPRWASTPLGALAFHLSGYAYAVHENVVMRAIRMAQDGDLTGADKMAMAGKISLALLAAVPAQAILGEIRSQVFDSQASRDSFYKDRWPELAVQRSGILGGIDPWLQILTGLRYHRDLGTSMAGPAGGRLLSAAQIGLNYAQGSQHTTGESRKATQAAYDALFRPAAAVALSRLPLPVAAVAQQVLGAGGVREAATSSIGGPAPPPRHFHK
jgi:hypothetical protein